MDAEKVEAGRGRRALRLVGKGAGAILLLLGLMVVGAQVDILPYVGSGRLDVFPSEFLTAPLPAYLYMLTPPLLTGLVLSVLSVAVIRGRFPSPDPVTLLKSWVGWFLAMFCLMCLAEAPWWWPLNAGEVGRVIRYAARCAAVAATLLTLTQVLLRLYAGWWARPQTRWGEAVLWFATVLVLTVGFSVAISLLGGLSAERLFSQILQGTLICGGLLAVAIALAPRSAPSRPGRTRTCNQTVVSGQL